MPKINACTLVLFAFPQKLRKCTAPILSETVFFKLGCDGHLVELVITISLSLLSWNISDRLKQPSCIEPMDPLKSIEIRIGQRDKCPSWYMLYGWTYLEREKARDKPHPLPRTGLCTSGCLHSTQENVYTIYKSHTNMRTQMVAEIPIAFLN